MPLFAAERHEPLLLAPWNAAAARAAIAEIVEDVHLAYGGAEALWPTHPIDRSPERADPMKALYYGAAGVIWTLDHLEQAGFPALGRDYRSVVEELAQRDRDDWVRLTGQPAYGYALGATGIHMLRFKLAPSAARAQDIAAAIEGNREHPALGFAWGSPGTTLAAHFMLERTGAETWRTLYLQQVDALWQKWSFHDDVGCWLWTQDLYGLVDRHLGALHGFPGIALALLVGRRLLPPEQQHELLRRVREALARTALREGAHANWRLCAGASSHPGQRELRVQHCTGAPGIVNTLAALPHDPETDALLLAAGELTWSAGPLAKLPSLCHGTPGSGYALLKLHARTGDEVWLDRARRFAMHAIEQGQRGKERHGQRKFSLWTGDLGLACYLWDCIRVSDRFPTLDTF
jgi:hypothetical protein